MTHIGGNSAESAWIRSPEGAHFRGPLNSTKGPLTSDRGSSQKKYNDLVRKPPEVMETATPLAVGQNQDPILG